MKLSNGFFIFFELTKFSFCLCFARIYVTKCVHGHQSSERVFDSVWALLPPVLRVGLTRTQLACFAKQKERQHPLCKSLASTIPSRHPGGLPMRRRDGSRRFAALSTWIELPSHIKNIIMHRHTSSSIHGSSLNSIISKPFHVFPHKL